MFYKKKPAYYPQKTQGHAPTHGFTKHTSDGSNYGATKLGVSDAGGRTDRYPTSILEVPVLNNDDPLRIHPTQKPVELAAWFVKSFTKPGDVVLDNACGSGAHLVAAKQLGRRYFGCDTDREFVAHTKKWLAATSACQVESCVSRRA